MRLSTAVGLAVFTGFAIAAVAEWILLAAFHPKNGGTSVDVTKLALTVVGGVGGVVALVIAYRRQRDIEQGRFVERFGAAAAQLGAGDVAVRIAGVYAMAGVGDESEGLRRQQCIDVLCGYLRLPYVPDLGANHLTKLVLKHHRGIADGTLSDDEERHLEYRQNDREVRRTIVRVIADRLRPTAENSWSANDFDFSTAYLENADFHGAMFSAIADFSEVTFSAIADFSEVTFSASAYFGEVTFSAVAQFREATFVAGADFHGATFAVHADFHGATFSGDSHFRGVMFSAVAHFRGATFSASAQFREARFSADADFRRATFSASADFRGATFSASAYFGEVDFGLQSVNFANPRQWGPPAPKFDWDADLTAKPANIKPQDWPPTVAATVS